MVMAGFLIQFFSVPEPKSVAELRSEIKKLKLQKKR